MGREMNWERVRSDVREIGRGVWTFVVVATLMAVAGIFFAEAGGNIDWIPVWVEYLAYWAVCVLLILGVWLFFYERWTEEGEV